MKTKLRYGFTLLETMLSFAVIALLAAFLLPRTARADSSSVTSFSPTNFVNTGVQYSNYPTNTTGIATGKPIETKNYSSLGFYISGDLTCSNASVIGVKLARNGKGASSTSANFESVPQYNILIPIPVGTNHFDWCTNLPADCVNPALYIGLAGLTNNFPAGCSLTNFDAGLTKKIIPIAYP